MIVELHEAKNWLRVDFSEDDALIQMLIDAAEEYIKNATGNSFDSTNSLAKLLCLVLVADWYENRELRTADAQRPTVNSILEQLRQCYSSPASTA